VVAFGDHRRLNYGAMEESRLTSLVITRGCLGMTVYFGCLVVYGEAKDSPQWLVYPAFVVMLIGVPLYVMQSIRASRKAQAREQMEKPGDDRTP
jgi:Flp pilus assembly protein TadB